MSSMKVMSRKPFQQCRKFAQPASVRRPAFVKRLPIALASNLTTPTTAKDAVELGTQQFEQGKYREALKLYQSAMTMNPNSDEARAATYNMACVYAKLRQWQEAADAVKSAVNKYNLKVEVAQKDPDLKQLRERREWLDAQDDMVGVMARDTRLSLRSEAKAPFRFARTTIVGGLTAGAGLGLFIITIRLIAALSGKEGAPDLTETAQNFGINLTAVIVLVFLLTRDLQSKDRDVKVIDKEERLARLQIALGGGERVVPLSRFRGSRRPIILAGSRAYVNRCLAAVGPFKPDLMKRGVCLVPVVMSDSDPDAKLRALKAEMAREGKEGKGFGGLAKATTQDESDQKDEVVLAEEDKKWQLNAHDTLEWAAWIEDQMKEKGITASNVYIQVQMDGSIRSSGVGVPSFPTLVDDLPPLDDIRTRFIDGVGPQAE